MAKTKVIPPPETKIGPDGKTFVKIFIRDQLRFTGKATMYALKVKQVINGGTVSTMNQDVWFPNHVHHSPPSFTPTNKFIWVEKTFYDNMRFVG